MSITTDRLVGDIQQMFKGVTNKTWNYWGLSEGVQFVPLACLKCSKCMYDFRDFADKGPRCGQSLWFCDDDFTEFCKKKGLLKKTAKSEGKNYEELYEIALEPLRKAEKGFERSSETAKARLLGKKWVFFG